MEIINKIACLLVVIGALNWGFIGFLGLDLVAALFGAGSMLSMIVYDIVGISAIWCIIRYAMSGHKVSK